MDSNFLYGITVIIDEKLPARTMNVSPDVFKILRQAITGKYIMARQNKDNTIVDG
jgi:hypothetical protein